MAVNFAKLPVFYNPRGEAFAFAKEVAAQPRCDPRGQTAPRPGCRGASARNTVSRDRRTGEVDLITRSRH